MGSKSNLLDQLRIERPAPIQEGSPRGPGGPRTARTVVLAGIAILVLAAASGFVYLRISTNHAIPVQKAIARTITLGSTDAANAGSLLDASGYVVALRDATVSAKAIYQVREMLVQQGETVKSGQIIARLDDSNVRAALEQAQAQATQARAALAQAKTAADDAEPTFRRQQKELSQGLISEDSFDATKATYDADQAAVIVAVKNLGIDQAVVAVNQRFEDDTVIRAPFDGVVTATNAQPGQIVSPQFSGGGGLAEIVDMQSLEVDVDVSENFISLVHSGQPAKITLDAYPSWDIPAHVIAIIPTADKTKATVSVRVGFKGGDPRVLPQMGARVSFLADAPSPGLAARLPGAASSRSPPPVGENSVVAVPSAAVQSNSDSSKGTVFVIEGNTVASHTVQLGGRSGDSELILSGLHPGTSVAIGDFTKLHDGAKVRISQ